MSTYLGWYKHDEPDLREKLDAQRDFYKAERMATPVKLNIDMLIDERATARLSKQWRRCDEIRDLLDGHLVFVFDAPEGQRVYYLTEKFFARRKERTTYRAFLEQWIQAESRVERLFDAWLFTINQQRKSV